MNDSKIVMYHNNFIVYDRNKKYRWREQGLLTDNDDGYYNQSPSGYLLVDNLHWDLDTKRRHSTPYTEAIRQLARFVRMFNRTLIMPVLPCPPKVQANNCTLCAWMDTCAYGFQRHINFNYKAHVGCKWTGSCLTYSKSYMTPALLHSF